MKHNLPYYLFDNRVRVFIFGKQRSGTSELLTRIARNYEITHIYCPETHAFNARVCQPRDFKQVVEMNGVKIHSGCLADGVVLTLPKNEAVGLQTADCPTIIARHIISGKLVVAHAGRASLIDENYLRNSRARRQPVSVVKAICEHLDPKMENPVCIEIFSCCGIGSGQFEHPVDHPEHGSFNLKMNAHIAKLYGKDCLLDNDLDRGGIDLHRLIFNQFRLYGVPGDNICKDQIDTANKNHGFFSRRGGDRTGHNTIMVMCT